MSKKRVTPKFKESTIKVVELFFMPQDNCKKQEKNKFELLINYPNKLQWLFKEICKRDNYNEEKDSILFKNIPTKILPWLFYAILLSAWIRDNNPKTNTLNINEGAMFFLREGGKRTLLNMYIHGSVID